MQCTLFLAIWTRCGHQTEMATAVHTNWSPDRARPPGRDEPAEWMNECEMCKYMLSYADIRTYTSTGMYISVRRVLSTYVGFRIHTRTTQHCANKRTIRKHAYTSIYRRKFWQLCVQIREHAMFYVYLRIFTYVYVCLRKYRCMCVNVTQPI